jgi:cation diffusion facilitator family transporter
LKSDADFTNNQRAFDFKLMSANASSVKIIVIAFFANLGIAIAKFAGALVTGSASMLAEAVHSLVDSCNQVLLLVGNRRAQKPADALHPLGYGREAFFWSFIVALMLFSLGGLFAIYEGWHKISHLEGSLSSPWIGLGILFFSLVVEGYSFYACWREIKVLKSTNSLRHWIKNTKNSELLVVFLEDSAALLGLMVATVCLVLSIVTGDAWYDGLGSIIVGVLLISVSVVLGVEVKSFLVGESANSVVGESLVRLLHSQWPGARVLKFIGLQTGSNEILVSCKIHPGQETDLKVAIDKVNSLEKQLKQLHPEVRWSFVELDHFD